MSESENSQSIFKTKNLILGCILWAVLALIYYLLFSSKVPVNDDGPEIRQVWYLLGTNIFEATAYLIASILCLRNWLNSQLVGNRNIWLLIALGMFSYFIGGVIFGYTEIVLKVSPDASPGDIFFVITYLLLGIGMTLAVISSRINLAKRQWLIVLAVGLLGSSVSGWIYNQQASSDSASLSTLAIALNAFYIVSDVILLVIATILLLTFWGGKVSLSWRMIAAAAFSLYIADMWFAYAQATQGDNYQSGELLEVFWVFSGILFAMGAVLEYDISLNRKRRMSGRKQT